MPSSIPDQDSSSGLKIPRHIAIIMDGNNRWAKQNRLSQPAGHRAGVEAIRDVLDACKTFGVEILTLFAFSSENWQRPRAEVNALMSLFLRYLDKEVKQLKENGVRLRIIGQRSRFSAKLQERMARAEAMTAENSRSTLVIAADYGGRWDIAQASKKIALGVKQGDIQPDDVNEELLASYINLGDLPAPDLCIRTGGDHRISNFLLWQFAYTELYFTEVFWPQFRAPDLQLAIEDYSARQRRFGGRVDEEKVEEPHA
jgi:undecaprenyl diphosphate synthase